MENNNKSSAGTMVASLLVGGVIGAALGILMAPTSGEKPAA